MTRHGFTPGTGPFADPEKCRVMLARYVCPYPRDEHPPDLPPENVDAERDALAAKLDTVREMHGPRVVQVLGPVCSAEECDHEAACPLVDYTVCGHCYDVGDGAHPYAYEEGGLQDVAHPCATYRALDATPETGGAS